jgi:hypothetical protein
VGVFARLSLGNHQSIFARLLKESCLANIPAANNQAKNAAKR